MIHIERAEEPEFWRDYRTENPSIKYDDLENTEEGRMIRQRLRQHNIAEQHGLCAYCCSAITIEKSINEHIKPRGSNIYAQLSMDYDNIVACCITTGDNSTCSDHKKNYYDSKLFVSPLEKDCESYFEYYSNGEVVSDSLKGQYTIELLNLNSYRLRRAREAQLKACKAYHSPEMVKQVYLTPNKHDHLMPFIDIVKYYYIKGEL